MAICTGNIQENGLQAAKDVSVQDQTTPPVDALFSQSVSNFTISADTVASGIPAASFVYTFEATAGHGIVAGNELLLLDPAANREFHCFCLSVATNTITVDRPIDHLFPAASTLGRIVTTNMNVNGATTPQVFSVRAGAIPTDIVRFIVTIVDNDSMDDGKFGGLASLTRGLVFRIVNSYQKTVFCFKNNGEIKQFCFDGDYTDATLGPSGNESFTARITFGGPSKHGIVFRIKNTDVLQWVVQDDLTGLVSMRVSAMGHDTENEEV
jgi:hypothetical protein